MIRSKILSRVHRSDVPVSVYHTQESVMPECLIIGDVDHEHLVKEVFAGFSHPQVTMAPL